MLACPVSVALRVLVLAMLSSAPGAPSVAEGASRTYILTSSNLSTVIECAARLMREQIPHSQRWTSGPLALSIMLPDDVAMQRVQRLSPPVTGVMITQANGEENGQSGEGGGEPSHNMRSDVIVDYKGSLRDFWRFLSKHPKNSKLRPKILVQIELMFDQRLSDVPIRIKQTGPLGDIVRAACAQAGLAFRERDGMWEIGR